MKKFSLIAILLIAVMMIVGCSHNAEVSKNADESESISFSANNTENNNSKIVTENESSTQISTTETTAVQNITKPKTEESTTTSTTTAKSDDKKSAGQGTTKPQSQTTTKKQTTTQKRTTTQKQTTTQKPVTTTEKSFDVSYWVSYAKDYARSVGLEVNSSASDCWDNPISANSKCKYLERDIKGRLNRYAKDEDITQIWVWAEKTSADSYNIYIGYA